MDRFIIGDVIAHGTDYRNPYGRVVGTGKNKQGRLLWQIRTTVQAPVQKTPTVWRKDDDLIDFSPIVSAVRGVCGNILINDVAAIYNETIAKTVYQQMLDDEEAALDQDFG